MIEAKREISKQLDRNPNIILLRKFCESRGINYQKALTWCQTPEFRVLKGRRILNIAKKRSNPFPDGWQQYLIAGKWHVVEVKDDRPDN